MPGWFTADIVELVNQKRELTKACKCINSNVNYRKLVECRNKLRKMLRKAKHEVVVNSLENFHSNSRKFWKTLNEDLGLRSKSSNDKCVLIKKSLMALSVGARTFATFLVNTMQVMVGYLQKVSQMQIRQFSWIPSLKY